MSPPIKLCIDPPPAPPRQGTPPVPRSVESGLTAPPTVLLSIRRIQGESGPPSSLEQESLGWKLFFNETAHLFAVWGCFPPLETETPVFTTSPGGPEPEEKVLHQLKYWLIFATVLIFMVYIYILYIKIYNIYMSNSICLYVSNQSYFHKSGKKIYIIHLLNKLC